MGRAGPSQGVLRPARLLAGGLALAVVLAGCGQSSYQYNWNILVDSVIRPDRQILSGVWLTLSISIVSQLIGIVLGIFGALGKMSKIAPIRWLANVYVWFFRGTPLLVQITFLYFGLGVTGIYRFPEINLFGVGISGAVQAGILALGVNEGAYMSEIVRAGILAIDPGQLEAAKSLGMTYGKAMRRIILPQAARVIVPPLGNEFNNMLKTTSLLVIISVPELYVTFSRKNASGPTVFHPFELFLAAAVWYLVLTTIWGVIQSFIERRLAKGVSGTTTTPTRRLSLRERLLGGGPAERAPQTSGGR